MHAVNPEEIVRALLVCLDQHDLEALDSLAEQLAAGSLVLLDELEPVAKRAFALGDVSIVRTLLKVPRFKDMRLHEPGSRSPRSLVTYALRKGQGRLALALLLGGAEAHYMGIEAVDWRASA